MCWFLRLLYVRYHCHRYDATSMLFLFTINRQKEIAYGLWNVYW